MQRWAAKSNPNLHQDRQALSIPKSPRQVNAGERRQMVRCPCPSALNCDALRRFCEDKFLGIGLKPAYLTRREPVISIPAMSRYLPKGKRRGY